MKVVMAKNLLPLTFLAALFSFALISCEGAFLNPSLLEGGLPFDTKIGELFLPEGYGGILDTARNVSKDRTRGLVTSFPPQKNTWPPKELIAMTFPASKDAPGLDRIPGEGTVIETEWSKLEKDIVLEINKFRQDPVGWCKKNGLPLLEGMTVEEEFYSSASPRAGDYYFPAQIVKPSAGLHKSALHQAYRGVYEHSDVSRVKCYVSYRAWDEIMLKYSYSMQQATNKGYASIAARIVNEFVNDRGAINQRKGHRWGLSYPGWDKVGVGCYKDLVVIQFGYNVVDK